MPRGTGTPPSTGPPPRANGLFTVKVPWFRVTPPEKVLLPALVKFAFCAPRVRVLVPLFTSATVLVPFMIWPAKVVLAVPSTTKVPGEPPLLVMKPPAVVLELPSEAKASFEPFRSRVAVSLSTRLVIRGVSAAWLPKVRVPCCTTRLPPMKLVPLRSRLPGPNLVKPLAVMLPLTVAGAPPV